MLDNHYVRLKSDNDWTTKKCLDYEQCQIYNSMIIHLHLYSATTVNVQWRCLHLKLVRVEKLKLYLEIYNLQ